MPQIKLQSDDGQVFDIPSPMVKFFETISSMVEDPFDTKEIVEVVPVPNVNASSLEKVLEWAEYHMDDDPHEANNKSTESICEWDQKLLQVEKNVLIELVLAAHYLGIQALLDITSKAVIDMINNSAPEKVEHSVTMDDDFVAEQQQKDFMNMTIESGSDSDDDEE